MRHVLLHPHPDMGGTRHNGVIRALEDRLEDPVAFDFASSAPDVAVAQVLEHLGDGPAWLVGYSFGGGIASLVDDPRVRGWVLVAPALAMVTPVVGPDPRPKHVLAGARDTFFPPGDLLAATAGWVATSHATLDGADHFLAGRERDVADHCAAWLATQGA